MGKYPKIYNAENVFSTLKCFIINLVVSLLLLWLTFKWKNGFVLKNFLKIAKKKKGLISMVQSMAQFLKCNMNKKPGPFLGLAQNKIVVSRIPTLSKWETGLTETI